MRLWKKQWRCRALIRSVISSYIYIVNLHIITSCGEPAFILSYQMFRPTWNFDQADLIDKAKPMAEFWKLDQAQLVASLRHLMALRDTVLQREAFESAAPLWLAVAQEGQLCDLQDPGSRVLFSFLLGQSQSAACERTFAQVVEMQTLWLAQKVQF